MELITLADHPFVPCPAGAHRLEEAAAAALKARLDPSWTIDGSRHLRRTFRFPDFAGALAFVNRVGALADTLDHHPDVHLAYGKATIELWTHTVDGLCEGDFIFAARVDKLA